MYLSRFASPTSEHTRSIWRKSTLLGSPLTLQPCSSLSKWGDREGYRLERGHTEHFALLWIVSVEATVFRVGLGGGGKE